MKKLLSLLARSSRGAAILAMFAGMLSGATAAGLIAVVNEALTPERPEPKLLWAFIALLLAVPLSRLLSDYLLVRLGQKAVYDLRLMLTGRILATPLRRLESMGPHRLLVALTDDINAITVAIADLPTLFVNMTLLVACMAYLGWLSPVLLAVFLGSMAFGVVTYRVAMRAGVKGFRRAREQQDELYAHFRSLTEGAKELKLHNLRRRAFLELLEGTAQTLNRLNISARMVFSAAGNWGSSLFFIIIGLVIFGRRWLPAGIATDLTGFILVLFYIRGPLQVLMNSLPQLGRGGVALDKVERLGLSLLDDPAELQTSPVPKPELGWKSLELRGVRHFYRGEAGERGFSLGPLDLVLRPGEIVFLIGGNGSGKTTFAKLLTGLYASDKGEILLDGRQITESDREEYRQQFSAVFSEFHLFDQLLGIEGPDLDTRARRYLEDLQLTRKVTVHNGKLSTLDLSRGQRKRLALLAAYLEDRPIYVFDEWAADQDPEFKEVFYRRFLPDLKARGKAVLVISHDDRFFGVGDRLLKLEQGQLILDTVPAGQPAGTLA